ncbi:PadR family transcriptional regulator [Lipingzhangella sp. LS1_29]|uniref:PadR family transcriptional regulator n=1 Tax=Lipingzhangella rawalii TaxID=2055835 RepID=A0ABU2H9Q2_9ACTN|nr:PadR family transcriptional regulator [Lipingzhangella rawalii]MDS1272051.1 PadR family transcriptional regulator [Lipingzhangella rawalii]
MSTIFGHGRLRLYLLKLLEENPRHGYEIISLLRDRFLGVYSPSPGTIYPRLARLEEEGLVTHEEVDGRKVYRLTEAGRAELNRRSADLDDLERDLTDSVRDIARAVQRDVRDTIGTLREELKSVAGDARRQERDRTRDAGTHDPHRPQEAGAGADRGAATGPDSGDDAEDVWSRASREGNDGSAHDDTWWHREWERLRHSFVSWGNTDSQQVRDLERTLREFTNQIREAVRDAGQLSGTATTNLRQMLDETIAVLRRDLAHWGPTSPGTSTDARAGTDSEPDPGSADAGDATSTAADTAATPDPQDPPAEAKEDGHGRSDSAQPGT